MKVALLTLTLALSALALVGCDEKKPDGAAPAATSTAAAAPSGEASAKPAEGGW